MFIKETIQELETTIDFLWKSEYTNKTELSLSLV